MTFNACYIKEKELADGARTFDPEVKKVMLDQSGLAGQKSFYGKFTSLASFAFKG